jgi:hypothetical protein
VTAAGSPAVSARSSSRAWRRSWSRSGRWAARTLCLLTARAHVQAPSEDDYAKQALLRSRGGGLRSCPRTQRRPPAPVPAGYTPPSSPATARRPRPEGGRQQSARPLRRGPSQAHPPLPPKGSALTGNRHSSRAERAQSVLIPQGPSDRWPAGTTPNSKITQIFEGTNQIQRVVPLRRPGRRDR